MPRGKKSKGISLEDAHKRLKSIQTGLDNLLEHAQRVLPALGDDLGGLLARHVSILSEGGRAGLEVARREVAAGSGLIERLLTELGKLDVKGAVEPVAKARTPKRGKRAKASAKAKNAPAAGRKKKSRGKKNAQSLPEAIAAIMAERKDPMKAAEVAANLMEQGYKSAAKNFRAVVQVVMSKGEKFKKDPEGGYRLA